MRRNGSDWLYRWDCERWTWWKLEQNMSELCRALDGDSAHEETYVEMNQLLHHQRSVHPPPVGLMEAETVTVTWSHSEELQHGAVLQRPFWFLGLFFCTLLPGNMFNFLLESRFVSNVFFCVVSTHFSSHTAKVNLKLLWHFKWCFCLLVSDKLRKTLWIVWG